MNYQGLIVLGAFIVWFGGFILVFSYPVLRLRPLLDEGTKRFNWLYCILRGQFQGREVTLQYKTGGRTGGTPRFLVSMPLRQANVIQSDQHALLENANIFIGRPRRPIGASAHPQTYGYVASSSHTPWAESWFQQPEVKRALDALFSAQELQDVRLTKGTLKAEAFSPWKASRPANVQAMLENFAALEESLRRSAR